MKPFRLTIPVIAIMIAAHGGVAFGQTVPPEGLVNYLNSRNQPSDLDSRRALWKTYRPDENYTGTSKQNVLLRGWLVADEYAPQPKLEKDTYAPGEHVTLTVTGTYPVKGYESDLAQQSGNAQGGVIDVGNAAPGVYDLRIFNSVGQSAVHLILQRGADGKLQASLMAMNQALLDPTIAVNSAAVMLGITPQQAKATLDTDQTLINRFFDGLTADLLEKAVNTAAKDWINDPATQIGLVQGGFVCTVAAGAAMDPATMPVAGVAWRECFTFAGAQALDLGVHVMLQAVEDHPNLAPSEKAKVKNFVRLIYAIKTITSARKAGQHAADEEGCKAAEKAFEAMGHAAETVENAKVAATLHVVSDVGAKYTTIVCKIIPKAPGMQIP